MQRETDSAYILGDALSICAYTTNTNVCAFLRACWPIGRWQAGLTCVDLAKDDNSLIKLIEDEKERRQASGIAGFLK